MKNSDPEAPEETTESHREDNDRQAIERGEDDGMIVPGSLVSSVHRGEDSLAGTGR